MNFVGVDLGGTKVLARMVDPETGAAAGREKTPTPKSGLNDVVDAIVGLVNDVDPDGTSPAIGIGVPGLVSQDGVVQQCANIAGWEKPFDIGKALSERLERPVVVGNDVNCGALGEFHLGAGRGSTDMMAVFVGTGVGGGIILDGVVRNGPRGQGGELGHTKVGLGKRPCGCGGTDHLETYAGKAGIEREARRRVKKGEKSRLIDLAQDGSIKSRHLEKALDDGCEMTIELMQGAADALARSIGNTAMVLDIDTVVLGGGIVDKLGESFIDQIRTSKQFGGYGPDRVDLRLVQRLDDAGVVGAAIMAANLNS